MKVLTIDWIGCDSKNAVKKRAKYIRYERHEVSFVIM